MISWLQILTGRTAKIADAGITAEQIYAEYRDSVIRYVYNRIGSGNEAEDVVLDIFERIVRYLPTYEVRASLSTWVYAIAKRAVADHYRKKYAGSAVTFTEQTVSDPEDEYIEKEALSSLTDALNRLDERERDIIILHYYKEMPLTEIAEIKCMSYSNTKVIHKAALAKLRKILSD